MTTLSNAASSSAAASRLGERRQPFFVGDIGATNARLAYVAPQSTSFTIHHYTCASFANLSDLITTFFRDLLPTALDNGQLPQVGALAVPCPVTGDEVAFTNLPWKFSIRDMTKALGLSKLIIVNDYEAIAKGLPFLTPDDYTCIGPSVSSSPEVASLAKVVIGPGSGLGGCGLVPYTYQGKSQEIGKKKRHWVPVPTEIGHVSFSPVTPDQITLQQGLGKIFGHVSWENIVSGPGIATLFRQLVAQNSIFNHGVSHASDYGQSGDDSGLLRTQQLHDPLDNLVGSYVGLEGMAAPDGETGGGKVYPSKLRFEQFEGLSDVSIGSVDPLTGHAPPPQPDPLDSPPTLVQAVIPKVDVTSDEGASSSSPSLSLPGDQSLVQVLKGLTPAQITLLAMQHQGLHPNPLFLKEKTELPEALSPTAGGVGQPQSPDVRLAVGRLASHAVALFFECLGTVAGNMALTFGAQGGVYLAGGILPKIDALLRASNFRTFFQNKGRFSSVLAAIPTYLITHPAPALVGLARQIWEEDQN